MTGPFTQNADHIFKCYLLENDPLPKAVPNRDYISFKKKCPVKKNHITEDYLHDFRKGLESELLEEEDDIIKWTNKIIALLKFSFFNEFDEERNVVAVPSGHDKSKFSFYSFINPQKSYFSSENHFLSL